MPVFRSWNDISNAIDDDTSGPNYTKTFPTEESL